MLSPVLFNVYLEEALKSSSKLEAVRKRGDLLAFADDMLIMTNNQNELVMVIEELTALQQRWNLRLNKKKSEILTKEDVQEVGGIKCTKTVKYLGVSHMRPVGLDEGISGIDRQERQGTSMEDRQGRT